MSSSSKPAKSPILMAVGISLAVALGALVASSDPATVADTVTGRFITRPFTDTQDAHTVAIAALEGNTSYLSQELDFVARRVRAAVRRNEEETTDRFAQLDAEIAALKEKIAGIQTVRTPRVSDVPFANANDVVGLRSSLNELASAHTSAVSELTKRLDKIEVKLGLSTDMTSSIGGTKPAKPGTKVRKPAAAPIQGQPVSMPLQPERGHLFNVKPISQQGAPLRLSGLRG